ncbi:MAG: sigma-70 family RNA polymerase sigma factor [Defluviitaleaceae bacterium]|nr:sigma-70 family RNA polymerase sigma factor [Defluviitaleaceae bacterium]
MEELRQNLVAYIKRKFYTRQNIVDMADDIVNQTFLDVMNTADFQNNAENRKKQLNFGYMSVACIRTAYRLYHKNDQDSNILVSFELTAPLVDESNFVAEIEQAEDTAFILQSLQTLKKIEQIIINERYYGDFSFREISERHNINLNTILSHHRRALSKLKPIFTVYFGQK